MLLKSSFISDGVLDNSPILDEVKTSGFWRFLSDDGLSCTYSLFSTHSSCFLLLHLSLTYSLPRKVTKPVSCLTVIYDDFFPTKAHSSLLIRLSSSTKYGLFSLSFAMTPVIFLPFLPYGDISSTGEHCVTSFRHSPSSLSPSQNVIFFCSKNWFRVVLRIVRL